MCINNYLETSIFVWTIRYVIDLFCRYEAWLSSTWRSSFTFRACNFLTVTVKTAFKNSMIGRLTDIDEHVDLLNPFETSIVAKWSFLGMLRISKIIQNALEDSVFFLVWTNLGNCFLRSPLQTGGSVTVIAVIFNLALTFSLNLEYAWYGILFKVVILLLGIACLFGRCSLDELMSGSLFLKKSGNKAPQYED